MSAVKVAEARQTLLEVLAAMGRDDLAVGEVTEDNGMVRFTLARGHFSDSVEIPMDVLADRQQARAQMNGIVLALSKRIEKQHIEAAKE